jgi:hypothetical protein
MFAAGFPDSILAGDPANYRDRMAGLFSGRLPYVDLDFEHLPGVIPPMALAWVLGGSASLRVYVLVFAGLMSLAVLGSGLLLRSIGPQIDRPDLADRFMVLSIPLLPFVLFRNDPWPVFLTVLAIWLFVGDRRGGLVSGALAILAKAWPVILAPIEWRRGNRLRAVVLGPVVGLLTLGIFLLPSRTAAMAARGLHTESIMGGLLGFWRSVQGTPLALERTASVYIDAPGWSLAVNAVVALPMVIVAMRALARTFRWDRAFLVMGSLSVGLMVASPYLSTQFVMWATPFAAASRSGTTRRVLLIVNVLSLILITLWWWLFSGAIWWWATLVVRNVLLVGVGFRLASEALAIHDEAQSPEEAGV